MKAATVPVYCLESYPQREPQSPFFVLPLEELIATFRGIDAPHTHAFYMLLYVTHGTGTHTIDFTTYAVQPGRLFFLAPSQVHSWQLSADCRGYVVFFDAGFYLYRFAGEQLFTYPFFSSFGTPVVDENPPGGRLQGLFEELLEEYGQALPNRLEVSRSLLHLLLERAARYYQPPAHGNLRLGEQAQAFEHLINQHFREWKTVQAYAARLHLTPNHLNALCRRHRNQTASALIQQRVLVEAKRLLVHSGQAVKQVAATLGFPDASYFGRFFRKHTGQSPDQFRLNR